MNLFVQLMLPAVEFFYNITHNYGMAIIFVTIAIKIAFYQMNAKQFESMHLMKKIQPMIKEIQKKHKKDPEKLQKETMRLYQEHGVNPLAGCLPLLLQLPFLIALFTTLNSPQFAELTGAKSFLWIKNITLAETAQIAESVFNTSFVLGGYALPLLAILVGLSTYYSQKTMSVDPEQQKMMAFMPVFMMFICMRLNAGVLLYWIVSNVLTGIQQQYMKNQRYVKEEIAVVEIEPMDEKK